MTRVYFHYFFNLIKKKKSVFLPYKFIFEKSKFAKTNFMKFQEALKKKKKILKNSSAFTKTMYDYVITPSIESESRQYIVEYSKAPENFHDETCKRYSSNSFFKVCLLVKNS